MKLKIKNIKNKETDEERVVLTVSEDCDIGKYFIFISKKINDKIVYTSIKRPFWFPDKVVKKGDLVVLYTKKGDDSFKENKDGSTSHFYFRNLKSPIHIDNYYALLVESNTWKTE